MRAADGARGGIPPGAGVAGPWSLRWSGGRHGWRHRSDGGFDRARYEVLAIPEALARAFVARHHYSRRFPAARLRYGLVHTGLDPEQVPGCGVLDGRPLVGVAVLGVPMHPAVLTRPFPGLESAEAVELSRFVLLDGDVAPGNSESFFVARVLALAAGAGIRGVVSFCDPVPRFRADGTMVFPGHVGTAYQAAGALYTAARGTPRTLLIGPDGSVFSERAAQKIRRAEQGWRYAVEQLVGWGAEAPADGPSAAWLARAVEQAGLRRLRHPGNHRFLWRCGRSRAERSRVQVALATAPYPKRGGPEALGAPAGSRQLVLT